MSEGKEPPCFLQLFQGGLIVHKGSREDGADKTGENTKVFFTAAILRFDTKASNMRVLFSSQLEVVLCPWRGGGRGLVGGGRLPAFQSALSYQSGASWRSEKSRLPVARL